MTALIVALTATATVASVDGSQKIAGRNQARAITANLAEQDQERMRSIRATDLANYTATRSVPQGGVPYQVDSATEFVQDANGTAVSCTSTGSQSQYMRLTSTVTPKTGLGAKPLSVQSIYALPIAQYSPTSGTMVVQIYQADGVTGQAGIPVNISGPSSKLASTNAKGCAVFEFLTPGSYSVSINSPGYVNTAGKQAVTFSGTVAPSTVNPTTPLLYDRAGSITVNFDTARKDSNTEPAHTNAVTLQNSGIPTTGQLTSTGPVVTGLFPFTGPYLSYSGTCSANDPSVANPTYWTANPGFGKQIVAAGAGYMVKVREPSIYTKVSFSGGPANQVVHLKQTDPACSASPPTFATTANGDGTLVRAGYPFGTYALCAQGDFGGTTRRVNTTTDVPNTNFNGVGSNATPAATLAVDSSSPAGACAF